MVDEPHAQDELGLLFDLVFCHYDVWLTEMPHVTRHRDSSVTSSARLDLACNVWPAVSRLCIRFEAQQRAELASRLERAYHDVEDYARIIDDYCTSDKFDYHLWYYGDPELEHLPVVRGTREELLARAAEMAEEPFASEEPPDLDCPAWALAVGKAAAEVELEKYPTLPTPDYAERTAVRAWACFWLAAQLHRAGLDWREASQTLEEYLGSILCVSETTYRIIPAALTRAYGQCIEPLPILESPEVSHILEMFAGMLVEIRTVTAPLLPVATGSPSREQPWREEADEFLPLSEAVKLVDDRIKLPTLSKLLVPDGEMRYMRKGHRCKVHLTDFRNCMKGRQSDPEWAKAFTTYITTATGTGDRPYFWSCRACGHEYAENANASATCPKCGKTCEIISRPPPTPRR
jgi:hypothetical protein